MPSCHGGKPRYGPFGPPLGGVEFKAAGLFSPPPAPPPPRHLFDYQRTFPPSLLRARSARRSTAAGFCFPGWARMRLGPQGPTRCNCGFRGAQVMVLPTPAQHWRKRTAASSLAPAPAKMQSLDRHTPVPDAMLSIALGWWRVAVAVLSVDAWGSVPHTNQQDHVGRLQAGRGMVARRRRRTKGLLSRADGSCSCRAMATKSRSDAASGNLLWQYSAMLLERRRAFSQKAMAILTKFPSLRGTSMPYTSSHRCQ